MDVVDVEVVDDGALRRDVADGGGGGADEDGPDRGVIDKGEKTDII